MTAAENRDQVRESLQNLMSTRWAEPALAWFKFLLTCPGSMTVQDLCIAIAGITQKAECRNCGREISSHGQNFWYHPQGGYRQCNSVRPASHISRDKASPKSGTVRPMIP